MRSSVAALLLGLAITDCFLQPVMWLTAPHMRARQVTMVDPIDQDTQIDISAAATDISSFIQDEAEVAETEVAEAEVAMANQAVAKSAPPVTQPVDLTLAKDEAANVASALGELGVAVGLATAKSVLILGADAAKVVGQAAIDSAFKSPGQPKLAPQGKMTTARANAIVPSTPANPLAVAAEGADA